MTETSTVRTSGSLQINQDLQFERRSWVIQRLGWMAMAAVVLAGVLGLFGPGPLNHRIAGQKGGALWADYKRFGRFQAPLNMQVHAHHPFAQPGLLHLWLNRDYTQTLQLKQIFPQPVRTEVAGNRLRFTFPISEATAEAVVTFTFEPEQFGSVHGIVGIEEGPTIELDQFIYP